MSDVLKTYSEMAATLLEMLGISVIILYVLYSSFSALIKIFRKKDTHDLYQLYKHQLARGILLGLEILVAADIIHTVAVELSFESLGVLAVIVLIRTFLSFTLELEATGKWPWDQKDLK